MSEGPFKITARRRGYVPQRPSASPWCRNVDMANLVAAGAFRFVHRGVGDFDEAFDDLPVEILMFRRQSDAANAQAGCHAPGCGRNREAHRLGGLKYFPSPVVLGDEEFLSADWAITVPAPPMRRRVSAIATKMRSPVA